MANYKLIALVEGNELELYEGDLYQIDRITTAFEDISAFLECLFQTEYAKYNGYNIELVVRTPHDNTIETAYSSVRNVLYDSPDSNNFHEFINEISQNTSSNKLLFNSLNKLINKRIIGLKENNKFNDENIEKLNMNNKYLWDRYFESKLDPEDEQTEELLKYKSEYNVLNKEITLTYLLNILIGNDDIKNLEHNLNTFFKGTGQNANKNNYRNYRDFYLQIASSYQTKYSDEIKRIVNKNNTKEEQQYLFQVMNIFKVKIKKYIDQIMNITANLTSKYSTSEEITKYYDEMSEKISETQDENEKNKLIEEAKLYEEDAQITKINALK